MAETPHKPITVEEIAHAFEEEPRAVDLSMHTAEDWVTMLAFWGMSICVILQFVTRYVFNNSLAWTEEIATNCLIVTVFMGAAMCVRLSRHIRVDFIYRVVPPLIGRWLALVVDLITIGFYGYATWLFWRYVAIVGGERMVTVDLPRGIVFYAVLAAFALMFVRAIQVFIGDMRRGGPRLDTDDIAPTGA